jgi:cyclophilin family peptidyl-prolyl cis-trans isomerase
VNQKISHNKNNDDHYDEYNDEHNEKEDDINEHFHEQTDINNVIIESDDEYVLTDGVLDQLDNVVNEYVKSKERPHVWFDIEVNSEHIGRIIIELFDDIVPYTVKNFIHNVEHNYKGSIFHRIIKDFIIQGGDYINGDGTGSSSIYGERFKDENFNVKHESKYMISMANSGPNTNGCQFFITLNPLPSLDNKHVVFGRVIEQESFDVIDQLGSTLTNYKEKPIVDCIIADCGVYNFNEN